MSPDQFPQYRPAQKLTAGDLNQSFTFLDSRDDLLGRIAGFGISCGLDGRISGSSLRITPGRAVDQRGRAIDWPGTEDFDLRTDVVDRGFPFLEQRPEGVSAVLVSEDDSAAADDCPVDPDDCSGTATTHTRTAKVVLVPGRVSSGRFDFGLEPLLQATPIGLTGSASYVGSPTALRDRIVSRLRGNDRPHDPPTRGPRLISDAAITRLGSISFGTPNIAAARAYHAMFINEVLLRTVELLRCVALHDVPCERDASNPGVVLGWATPRAGGGWEWHCGYRHAWEPPTGLSQAFMGGTCGNPCALYVSRLEAWINTYRPPDPPPPPPDDDDDGPFVVFEFCDFIQNIDHAICRVGGMIPGYFDGDLTVLDILDLDRIRDAQQGREIAELDREAGLTQPGPPIDREVLTGTRPINEFGGGLITLAHAPGHTYEAAAQGYMEFVSGEGIEPQVSGVPLSELADIPGIEFAGAATPYDQVVFGLDDDGRVAATARVAAVNAMRKVGTEVPAIKQAADAALAQAGELREGHESLGKTVGTIDGKVGQLEGEQQALMQWRGGVETTLTALDGTIHTQVQNLVGAQFSQLQQRVATMEGSLDVITKGSVGKGSVGVVDHVAAPGAGWGRDRTVATALIEIAETFNHALDEVKPARDADLFARYKGDAARATGKLEAVLDTNDAGEFNRAVLEVLDTMRTATKAAGVSKATATQMDAQYRIVRDMLR